MSYTFLMRFQWFWWSCPGWSGLAGWVGSGISMQQLPKPSEAAEMRSCDTSSPAQGTRAGCLRLSSVKRWQRVWTGHASCWHGKQCGERPNTRVFLCSSHPCGNPQAASVGRHQPLFTSQAAVRLVSQRWRPFFCFS